VVCFAQVAMNSAACSASGLTTGKEVGKNSLGAGLVGREFKGGMEDLSVFVASTALDARLRFLASEDMILWVELGPDQIEEV
jgi:hypothetical protein